MQPLYGQDLFRGRELFAVEPAVDDLASEPELCRSFGLTATYLVAPIFQPIDQF
jgi:hypothetical protein